jgi:hypothetical protein
MGFNVGFDARSSPFESVEAEEFVGNELKIARGLEGNEFAKKGNDRSGPGTAMVAAAGFDLKSIAVLEPASSKLVEAGFSYIEKLASFCDSNATGIEFMKGLKNELAWESAGELAFFIAPIDRIQLALGTPIFARFLAGALPRPPLRSGLLRAPAKKRVNGYFAPKSSFPLLNRLSSLLNRRQHTIPFPKIRPSRTCSGVMDF